MTKPKKAYTTPEIIFPELHYGGIPRGTHLDENLLPYIAGEISDHLNPYKMYTTNGRCYHKRYCYNVYNIRNPMHLYDAIDSQLTPCTKCRPRAAKDEWYIEMFYKQT